MRRSFFAYLIVAMTCGVPSTWAGLYTGADVGMTEPLNANFRGHVDVGFLVSPYVGYMLNDYVGVQGGPTFYFFSESGSAPGLQGQGKQETTMFAGTGGPRLQYPYETDWGTFVPFVYAEGGYFTGTGGRLSQSAPGFFSGGGLTYRITDELSLGVFTRYEYAFMGPRPEDLGPGQDPGERYSQDIRWLSYGFAVNYEFGEPEPEPPAPVVPVAAPAPKPEPMPLPAPTRKKIVLRSVYFEFDRSNISPDAAPVLDEASGLLRDEGDISIVAEGHTDNIGSDAYNEALGDRRAKSVRAYLINRGIAPKRIRTESFGESRPVATNETAEGRAQNRRVELRVEEPGRQ